MIVRRQLPCWRRLTRFFPMFAQKLCVVVVIVYARHHVPDDRLIVQKTKYRQLPNSSRFSVQQKSVASVVRTRNDLIASLCMSSICRLIGFWNELIGVWRLRQNRTTGQT